MLDSIARLPHDKAAEETAAQLRKHIANPPENSRIITYYPQVAAWVLEDLNVGNRPKKPIKITEYADSMAAQQWGLTGDTIKFGSDGLLKDGQNRLAACVRCGVPFRSHTVFGIDPTLFVRMDIGKNRNPADIFSIAGIRYAPEVAAATRWLVLLTSDNPLDRGTFTPEELLRRYQEGFSSVTDSIPIAQEVKRAWGHPTGTIAALHYLFAEKSRTQADAFMARWASSRKSGRGDPVWLLQQRLQSIKAQNHGRVHDGVRNALIIKAWNGYVGNEKLTLEKLQWHLGEEFPVIAGYSV